MTQNEKFLNEKIDFEFNKYVIARVLEETQKEEIIDAYFPFQNEEQCYILTEKRLYIFEGDHGTRYVSCRKAQLRDIKEFHLYFKNDFNNIALVTGNGHVTLVLKIGDYREAVLFMRKIYRQQVLNDSNVEGNPFEYSDYMFDLHSHELEELINKKEIVQH